MDVADWGNVAGWRLETGMSRVGWVFLKDAFVAVRCHVFDDRKSLNYFGWRIRFLLVFISIFFNGFNPRISSAEIFRAIAIAVIISS